MSAAHQHVEQPKEFSFTPDNLARAKAIIAKYPATRAQSALIPLLQLAQQQHDNWLPRAAMDYVAAMLDVPPIRAYEVASFYTMFNRAPVGKHLVQICTTTPCWLRGSDGIKKACHDKLGINPGQTTPDGAFTVMEVECLGACVNAPMLQIGDDYYEDLDAASATRLMEALKAGGVLKPGPQNGRKTSEPLGGATTLTSFPAEKA